MRVLGSMWTHIGSVSAGECVWVRLNVDTHSVSLSAGENACFRLNVDTHRVCVCRGMCVF